MKYRGIELPYDLGKKLKRFTKRGVGPLYVIFNPDQDVYSLMNQVFGDQTTLGELVAKFGADTPLKKVFEQRRKRLATPAEAEEYQLLIEKAGRYVDKCKARKDRQRAAEEAKELQRALRIVAKHNSKKEQQNAAKS